MTVSCYEGRRAEGELEQVRCWIAEATCHDNMHGDLAGT